MLRSALWLPNFDELADPLAIARLAAEAEEAGWHGVFVWDHINWRAPVQQLADPWSTCAAIATATEQVRLGPMVTHWRRRPVKLARETATLDRLSGGRLTLGVGLGSDRFGNYVVDGLRFRPAPVQQPRVPIWVAAFAGNARPLRRAARYDGFFPVNLEHPDQLAEAVARITGMRAEAAANGPYDVAVGLAPGIDPAPYAAAGATWLMVEFPWDSPAVDQVRGVLRDGPTSA